MRAVEGFSTACPGRVSAAALLFFSILSMLLSPGPGVLAEESQEVSPGEGREVFLASKCHLCHSVEVAEVETKAKSEKMRGPDLSSAGEERGGDWLIAFLKRQETLEGKEHKKEFKGTDETLQIIVDWLVSVAPAP